MRILVHGLAGCTKGGIETFILGMAEHISDSITFDYVLEKDASKIKTKMPGKGATFYIAPKLKALANLICWNKLLKDRKGIDSAVYFNWYSMAWLFPAIIARIRGYRVIIHAHNNKLHNCGLIQHSLHLINRQIQKFMNIERLTNSELSAVFFFGNKPATIVYNAIDTAKFAYNESVRNQIRNKLKIQDKHVYGFSGRITYQKNPLFLIEIFNKINEIDSKAAFLVCGDGDMLDQTRNKAEYYGLKVIFTGFVTNVEDYYQAMDVFILPSKFEGLGIVLIEAQCSGLPCIASSDVIPINAKVTDLVKFVKLNKAPIIWAKSAIGFDAVNREKYASIIMQSNFNILNESTIFKKILYESKNDCALGEKSDDR